MINAPRVTVSCDRCGYTPDDPFDMTRLAGDLIWDCRSVAKELIEYGWTLPQGITGPTLCEECSNEDAEMNAGQ